MKNLDNIKEEKSSSLPNPFIVEPVAESASKFKPSSTIFKDKDGVSKSIGSAVTDRAINDAATPEEVDSAIEVGNAVQNDAALNVKVKTALEPKNPDVGTGLSLLNAIGFDKYAEKGTPELSIQDITQGIMSQNPEIKQEYLDEFNNYANSQNAATPAIERLGIQDYYPDLGANINVGSYSRKTLGSGNIYVAQGGIIPRTVIDARNRAIEAKARDTQAKVDEIKNKRFVTTEQYQRQYDDSFLDWQNQYIKSANGNVQLLTDPNTKLGRDYLEGMTRWENLYKENKYVDGVSDSIRDAHQKGDYVTNYGLKLISDWDAGKTNMEDYISGKSNISNIAENLKSYQNTITWADEKIPELAKSGGITIPIKPNVDINNPEIAKNAEEAFIFKSNQSYDQYISGIRKYYDPSAIETIVDQAFEQNRFYKGTSEDEKGKLKANLFEYMYNSLGSEIKFEQKLQNNDKLGYAQLALANKKHQWDVDKETIRRETDKSFNQMVDEDTRTVGQDYLASIKGKNLTPAQKAVALKEGMVNGGFFSDEWSKRVGVYVQQVPMSKAENGKVNRGARSSEGNISFNNKNYTLAESRRQLELAKKSNDTKAIAHWTAWNEVLTDVEANGGSIDYYANNRLVTPMSQSVDANGNLIRKLGQYIDDKGDVNTLNIDVSTSYIARSKDKDGNDIDIVKQMPGTMMFYGNLTDDSFKAVKDATDPSLSVATKKGETHRSGGVITGESKSIATKR